MPHVCTLTKSFTPCYPMEEPYKWLTVNN